MERGEGSKQLPDLNNSIDEMVLCTLPPTFVQAKEEPNTTNDASNIDSSVVDVAAVVAANATPSDGPVKRGPGRPKGSFASDIDSSVVVVAAGAAAATPSDGPVKRGPGRPKGSFASNINSSVVVVAASGGGAAATPSDGPVKRGPGRPKGSFASNINSSVVVAAVGAAAIAATPSDGPVKRGPERPKGSFASNIDSSVVAVAAGGGGAATPSDGPVKRGPGRPKGSFASNINSSGVVVAANATIPSDGPVKRGSGRPKGTQNPTKKLKGKETLMIPSDLFNRTPHTGIIISKKGQETGNVDLVNHLLMRFDAVRRRLCQSKAVHGEVKLALDTFKALNLCTNSKKRVGFVNGVALGDIFFHYGEMGIVGLHTATVAVEFMGVKDRGEDNRPLALSVVSSGKNADVSEDPQTFIFTGLGGTEKYNGGQACDQTLERMNLALDTAMRRKSVVRVVRAKKDEKRANGKIYIYDGLYLITDMWEERAENGFLVFKFKFEREVEQKPAFEKWKWVEQWKCGLSTRPGLILDDISFGAENQKVALVNEVDDEKAPAFFTYVTSLKHTVLPMPPLVNTCKCISARSCSVQCNCVFRNYDHRLPYLDGILVCRRPIIHECGTSCLCSDDCNNRMIHTGLKFKFEVFKTLECGWGLRSWDPIRAGSFICEYAGQNDGEIVREEGDEEEDDEYLFDSRRVYKPFVWNYEQQLVCEDPCEKVFETSPYLFASPTILITGKQSGNVARFMNHSCSPNVFWQVVSREHDGLWCIHIAFFAKKHIPPLTELTYDYGVLEGSGKKMCLCRSKKCTGSFG